MEIFTVAVPEYFQNMTLLLPEAGKKLPDAYLRCCPLFLTKKQ
jgi:hypothetical protein